jgi:hypothetical protein
LVRYIAELVIHVGVSGKDDNETTVPSICDRIVGRRDAQGFARPSRNGRTSKQAAKSPCSPATTQ